MDEKWDKKYLTPLNEAVFIDVLKEQTTYADIVAKHGIKKHKVRQASFRFARGLYDWAYFADRLDLLNPESMTSELSPWETISGYRVHYRQWLALYREWQKAHNDVEER